MSDPENKTAVQRNVILKRKLGLIVQFIRSFLRNDSIKKRTILSWIWQTHSKTLFLLVFRK